MLVFYFLLSVGIGCIAHGVGRNGLLWCGLSLMGSPLIGAIVLLAIEITNTEPAMEPLGADPDQSSRAQ